MKANLLISGRQFTGASSLFVLLVLLFAAGCQKPNVQPPNRGGEGNLPFVYVHPDGDTSELVVMIKPGATSRDFDRWLDSVRRLDGRWAGDPSSIKVAKLCKDCDDSLKLLKGPGLDLYLSQQTASGGNTPTSNSNVSGGKGPSGEDGPVYYSINFPMVFNEPVKETTMSRKPFKSTSKRAVTVAVFDTGIDTTKFDKRLFYKGSAESCMGIGSMYGWNFNSTPGSPDFRDDHDRWHGTIVTALIVDQVYKYGNNSIRLLPVKVFSKEGKAKLFDILCGFSYAAKQGAEIINFSGGFPAPRYLKSGSLDPSAFLLKKYIETYLVPRNILLLAAAGNKNDEIENSLFPSYDQVKRRNLDFVCFYPASLARELKNVFAVTTVNETIACKEQNYSPNVVDIGVYADNLVEFTFQHPFVEPGSSGGYFPILGSSYATPIAAGKLCANYYLIEGLLRTSSYSKSDIWTKIEAGSGASVVDHNSSLEGHFIRSGIMKK